VETGRQRELREQQEALLTQQPYPQAPVATLLLPLPQPVMPQPPVLIPIVPVVPPVVPPVPPVTACATGTSWYHLPAPNAGGPAQGPV